MPAPRGQNFLQSPAWQRRVADAVNVQPGDTLVEIGGGLGDITVVLAARAAHLTVVEIDPRLAAALRQRLDPTRADVVEADILQVDLAPLAAAAPDGRLRVFGNLPYYISSPILFHLFHFAPLLRDAVVMLQREVADRVLAPPGAEFGLLSAMARFHCRPRRLFNLPPGAFRPAPQVHSTLLHLDFAPRAAALQVDPADFEAFLRVAFAGKRKRLVNNLARAWPRTSVEAALRAVALPPTIRAEALPVETLAALCRALGPRAALTFR